MKSSSCVFVVCRQNQRENGWYVVVVHAINVDSFNRTSSLDYSCKPQKNTGGSDRGAVAFSKSVCARFFALYIDVVLLVLNFFLIFPLALATVLRFFRGPSRWLEGPPCILASWIENPVGGARLFATAQEPLNHFLLSRAGFWSFWWRHHFWNVFPAVVGLCSSSLVPRSLFFISSSSLLLIASTLIVVDHGGMVSMVLEKVSTLVIMSSVVRSSWSNDRRPQSLHPCC